jgi:hypothetical protein
MMKMAFSSCNFRRKSARACGPQFFRHMGNACDNAGAHARDRNCMRRNISCSEPRDRGLRPFSLSSGNWATIDEFRPWFLHR